MKQMVEMVGPNPTDGVYNPGWGTCGFLVAVGDLLRGRHPEVLTNLARLTSYIALAGRRASPGLENSILPLRSPR
jgi:hypothetical protein